MAQGYIFDKLLNRKIEGETNLASLDSINEVILENSDENIETLGELANNVNDINFDLEIIKSGAPMVCTFDQSLDQISLDSVQNLKLGDFIYSEADEVLGVLILCNAESNQYQVQTVENQQLCLYSYLGSTCTKYTAESGTKLYCHKLNQLGSGQEIDIITNYPNALRVGETSNVDSVMYSWQKSSKHYFFIIKGLGTLFQNEIVVVVKSGPTSTYNLAIKSIDFTNSQITYTDIDFGSNAEVIEEL